MKRLAFTTWRLIRALGLIVPPLILAGLACGCGPNSKTAGVLATVNGKPVTEESFRYHWNQKRPEIDTPESRKALFEELIQRSTLAQKARQAGLMDDPVVVETIEGVLAARLREKQLQPILASASVSDEEVQAYYDANLKERYVVGEQVRAAVLWFETRGQEPLVQRYRPRLEKTRGEVRASPETYPSENGFGAQALANSEHRSSRFNGGDLGWLEAGQETDPFRKTILDAALSLNQPGDLSEVFDTDQGAFVVRLIDRRPPRIRSLESVRERIRRELLAARRNEVEKNFYAQLRSGASIHRNERNLDALTGLTAHSQNGKQLASHFIPTINP